MELMNNDDRRKLQRAKKRVEELKGLLLALSSLFGSEPFYHHFEN